MKLGITVRNTNFTVTVLDTKALAFVNNFANRFHTFKRVYDFKKSKKYIYILDKFFGNKIEHRSEFMFVSNVFTNFVHEYLALGFKKEDLVFYKEVNPKRIKINLKFIDRFILKDYQIKYKNTLSKIEADKPFKLVDLQMGKGKTVIACKALTVIEERTAIVIQPKLIPKWIGDIKENILIDDEDILVIQGGEDLGHLLSNKPDFKIVIISNKTLANYFKDYENDDFVYDVEPINIAEELKISILLIDEIHEDFYSMFKICLYFNVREVIGLTATLETEDPNIARMHRFLFPMNSVYSYLAKDRYINFCAIKYRIYNLKNVKYLSYLNRTYDHIQFEKSILKLKPFINEYLDMINYYVVIGYLNRKKDKQKLAIYASTVKMCEAIVSYLSNKHPDLDVRKFTAGDDYDNVITPDIRVSTPKKSGSAIDIPGLITVIQTINIRSIQANLQIPGRLRKIEDFEVWFYYLWSSDIEKHKEYHIAKKDQTSEIVKKFIDVDYPYPLRENKIRL